MPLEFYFNCQFICAASGSTSVADAFCPPETTAPSPGYIENHLSTFRVKECISNCKIIVTSVTKQSQMVQLNRILSAVLTNKIYIINIFITN